MNPANSFWSAATKAKRVPVGSAWTMVGPSAAMSMSPLKRAVSATEPVIVKSATRTPYFSKIPLSTPNQIAVKLGLPPTTANRISRVSGAARALDAATNNATAATTPYRVRLGIAPVHPGAGFAPVSRFTPRGFSAQMYNHIILRHKIECQRDGRAAGRLRGAGEVPGERWRGPDLSPRDHVGALWSLRASAAAARGAEGPEAWNRR